MAKPPPPPSLPCPQCGYENEPERVYCHNCGTKLDRSILPKDTKSPAETIAATRRRIQKLQNPGQGLATLKTFLNTLVWAAMIAALYLLFSSPEHVPSREKEAGANLISVMIDDALQSPAASTLRFTEADLSQHLRNRVKGAAVIPGLDFKRAYAAVYDGKVLVGIEQDFLGISMYSTVEYELSVVNGQFRPKKVGQYFGRLGIDPSIPNVDQLFAPIWAGLKREQQVLPRLQGASITNDLVTLVLKPAGAAAQ